ncbi:MAG: hypothetical protein ACYSR3_08895 [Planctomycetota bacterium]
MSKNVRRNVRNFVDEYVINKKKRIHLLADLLQSWI